MSKKIAMEYINFTPAEEKKWNKENLINPTEIRNGEEKNKRRPQGIANAK